MLLFAHLEVVDAERQRLLATAGALPGAMKNLLEWTVGGIEITGKPTGWVNPSTGPTGARGTYETLRVVLEYTDALVVPDACVTAPVNRAQILEGVIADDDIRAHIRAALSALAEAAQGQAALG